MVSTVGIVGCGLLGSAVARTLARSGWHEVCAWNRSPAGAEALAPSGVRVLSTVEELVTAVDLVLVTVTTYEAAAAVLAPLGDLHGATIVVLSTGRPAEAKAAQALITRRGGGYLDAALLGYPADLGEDETTLMISGPDELWERHAATFRTLGGRATHCGIDVAAANVLDVAATGAFYTVAYGAIVEAATYATARQLDPTALVPAAEAWWRILRRNIDEVASALAAGAYETDQATIAVYLEAATAWREELTAAGTRGRLMAAEEENLAQACARGLGPLGFAAQSLAMREAALGGPEAPS